MVVVTFGWGGQPVARRCSCSEVWLEKRSEQQAVRPSLFIREEMKLQPQPHIDLLISGATVAGSDGGGHFLVFAESPRVVLRAPAL